MCHFKILIKHEFINIRLIPTQISSFLEHFLLDHHFSFIYQILFKRKSIYTYIYIYIYKTDIIILLRYVQEISYRVLYKCISG